MPGISSAQCARSITGCIGECEVGDDEHDIFVDEVGKEYQSQFEEIIESVGDENGCHRPASIFPTPGRLNDGHGKHFDAEPGQTGFPAYESVAIFFWQKPSEELIELMKKRAAEYVARDWAKTFGPKKNSIKIRGFRWVTRKESFDEEVV
jgi:hypothetical protein